MSGTAKVAQHIISLVIQQDILNLAKKKQQGLECFQEKNDIMEIKTIGKINENPTQHSTDAPSEGGKTTAEEDNNSNVLVCTGK